MAGGREIDTWLSEIGSNDRLDKQIKLSAARLLLLRTEQKLKVAPYCRERDFMGGALEQLHRERAPLRILH